MRLINKINLKSKNLFYRELKASDASNKYLQWLKDSDFILNKAKTVKDLKKYIITEKKKSFFFGIFDIKTGSHIGNIKFSDYKKNSLFIGILIGNKKKQNLGLFKEILNFFTFHFFHLNKIKNFYLSVDKKNIQALKAYKKNNFIKIKSSQKNILMKKNINILSSRKLVIGTAQLDKNYGVMKGNNNFFDTLKFCKKSNYKFYDTSELYQKSYKKIEKNFTNVNLIIKVTLKKNRKPLTLNHFKIKVKNIIKNIKKNNIYAFMIHDLDITSDLNRHIIYLSNFCKNNKIKFGFSIYSINEFNFIKKFFNFNILQVPINVFNTDFLNKSFKRFVQKKNIEIHARSIFLQGLLLTDLKNIPKKFFRFKNFFSYFYNFCRDHEISRVNYCLNFILNYSHVSKIVIGFKNSSEILEILTSIDNRKKINAFKFSKKVPAILKNPSLWGSL